MSENKHKSMKIVFTNSSRSSSTSNSRADNSHKINEADKPKKRTRRGQRRKALGLGTDIPDNASVIIQSYNDKSANRIHRMRKKNPKTDVHSIEQEQEQPFEFSIKAIDCHSTGRVIRRKTVIRKRICLKSFIRNNSPVIFVSNLITRFGSLSISKTSCNDGRTKAQIRKYFVNIIPDLPVSKTKKKDKINCLNSLSSTSTAKPSAQVNVPSTSTTYSPARSSSHSKPTLPAKSSSTEASSNKQLAKANRKPKKPKQPRIKQKINNQKDNFPSYYTKEQVSEGLESGALVKGYLRINPKNFRDAYVNNTNTSLPDYYLQSLADRNRALDGDKVVLLIKPQEEWVDGAKTAVVVAIEESIHPRVAVGSLKPPDAPNALIAMFHPRDLRIPRLQIPAVSWPHGFRFQPKLFEKTLFLARLINWNTPTNALGILIETLGMNGELKVETTAILREFCLDVTPFPKEIQTYLPKSTTIPKKEFSYREDVRSECVFTIDPLTARDLDDAVSVKELPNGNYEIGVHISDASFYLEEGTALDVIVSKKATTIYLVDNVYHMLPVELCLHCSLLPNQDKLAFSVFWEMNAEGDIFSTRFARTIVNSCTQLAYEHAQMMIEDPNREFTTEELPSIHHGYTGKHLSKIVNILQNIAVVLRGNRVKNGALKIDQVKLSFTVNPADGEPESYRVYENKEAHRLIEEFMLLANISVAKRISETYPDIAFLRCHEPPKNTMLLELQNNLETYGVHLDITSSGGIHSSLCKYITEDFLGQCRGAVLNHLVAKSMTRARYYCAATAQSDEEFTHYALSVPIYTHFTSPIRRYADIMVHRLLSASLGYTEKPAWDVDYVTSIAANCNAQKYNAKRAGESSSDLYLARFVEKNQPYIVDGVVVDVKERSFDVIILATGSIVRVYQNSLETNVGWQTEVINSTRNSAADNNKAKEGTKKILQLTLKYPKTDVLPERTLVIQMFALVKVNLKRKDNTYKLECNLQRPM